MKFHIINSNYELHQRNLKLSINHYKNMESFLQMLYSLTARILANVATVSITTNVDPCRNKRNLKISYSSANYDAYYNSHRATVI